MADKERIDEIFNADAVALFVKAVERLVDLGMTRDELNEMLVDLVEVEEEK